MLLAFVFILLAVWVGILVSVYSVFFPFIKNLWDIWNFNTAYYGAISSVERGELAIKYHQPWFEWSWWFYASTGWGPISDYKTWSFGFINNNPNGMSWSISSRTTSIPNPRQWNVEYLLAAPDSSNYNMLDYQNALKLILSYDNTSSYGQYYTATNNIAYFTWGAFNWAFRLPPKVFSWFGNDILCTNALDPACNTDGDLLGDDIVVDRSLEWFNGGSYFKIIPNISVLYYSWSYVDKSKDIAIRKSLINLTWQIWFGDGL
jgi:hypothetical protein